MLGGFPQARCGLILKLLVELVVRFLFNGGEQDNVFQRGFRYGQPLLFFVSVDLLHLDVDYSCRLPQ